ncbi:MAG: DUF5060 domain-containing protein [Bryobacteraceae bacterium]
MVRLLALAAFASVLAAAETPIYTPIDVVLEMTAEEAAEHPNPYLTVSLHAEFRSPRFRTTMINGFWDGGRRLVLRFTPQDPGEHVYRITSNLKSINGKTDSINATASDHPGFIRPDNVYAWSTTETRVAHLWMGDTSYRFAWIPQDVFDQVIEKRAAQKFTHIRGLLMHNDEKLRPAYLSPDQPNIEHFQQVDARVLAMNRKGIFADLILAGDQNHLAKVFPEREQRERYIKYVASRYAPMMITWQGVQEFEEYEDGRALLKEIGAYLKKYDPYSQPRTTHTTATSGPLLADGWMNYVLYQSSSIALGAVERQILRAPLVNAEFGYEDSGAGKSHPHHVDSAEYTRRLWNATMNGQYPTFGNTGTYGGRKFEVDPKYLDSPGAKAMTAWYDFFAETRFWELQPFFEVDGGRALALEGVEYIVYMEKPGPVQLVTEKKKYEVYWFRPSTGELINEKKDYKGERFAGSPPDNNSDWVLHLSRDGRKEGMLKSWKFASRPVFQQQVEAAPAKIPFEIASPAGETVSVGEPVQFEAKLTKETKASKEMLYLWTVEATADGRGYRVLGDGSTGKFRIPAGIASRFPAVLNLRLYGINANGKVYALDKIVKGESK